MGTCFLTREGGKKTPPKNACVGGYDITVSGNIKKIGNKQEIHSLLKQVISMAMA